MRMTFKGIILLVVCGALLLNGAIAALDPAQPIPLTAPPALQVAMPGSIATSVSGAGTVTGIALVTSNSVATGISEQTPGRTTPVPTINLVGDVPTVIQDIYMSAAVPAGLTGSASAEMTPSTSGTTSATSVVDPALVPVVQPTYTLTSTASGTAKAKVTVTTAGLTANRATAQIYALARTGALPAGMAVPSVNGRAYLDASLRLDGAATGEATASGQASYSASATSVVTPALGPRPAYDTTVAGTVAGTANINGTSANGGVVSGLTTQFSPLAITVPTGVIYGTDFDQRPTNYVPEASAHLEANSLSPTTGALAAAAAAGQPIFQAQTISQASAVSTRGIIVSGVTDARGSVEGSAQSSATTQGPFTLTGSATQNAMQNVRAQSNYILDQSVGYSRVYSEANHEGVLGTPDDIAAFGEVNNYALASRINPGLDLCYGQGNVPSATWAASLNTIYAPVTTKNNPSVSVSGNGGWVAGVLPGFRAAATLAGSQPTPSTTSTRAATSAIYTSATAPGWNWVAAWAPGQTQYRDPTTVNGVLAQNGLVNLNDYAIEVTAPLNPNALTDAAGGWNTDPMSATSRDTTKVISTSIVNWNAVKWMQGLDPSFTAGWTDPNPLPNPTFSGALGISVNPTDAPALGAGDRSNFYGGSTYQRTPV